MEVWRDWWQNGGGKRDKINRKGGVGSGEVRTKGCAAWEKVCVHSVSLLYFWPALEQVEEMGKGRREYSEIVMGVLWLFLWAAREPRFC